MGGSILKEIYLDNSATTKVCDPAVAKMVSLMTETYGNPSSLHKKGFEAEQELKAARAFLAETLGAERDEICFTSGGTEANNLALFGAATLGKRFGKRIVSTAFEHPSVLRVLEALQKEGFEVCLLKPDRSGKITKEEILGAITPDTVLVSIMAVNNEVGTILPFSEIGGALKKIAPRALFHVDAVQAFCKIPIDVRKSAIDLLSASAHKIHGPKGAGLLYVKKGIRLPARALGGGQERGLRSGTEALPAIGGFAAAAQNYEKPAKLLPQMREKALLCRTLLSGIEGVLLQSPEDALPYIVNFSLPGIRSETMLHFLSGNGIYVSSGSACAGGEKSHVLAAMGLPAEQIDSSIRLSFSRDTDETQIRTLAETIKLGSQTLMRTAQGRKKTR